jgi:uncharacterized SAM-binding protein YcdF (DUF218 family)
VFFYCAKILWLLAQPSSIITLALTVGTIGTAKARARMGRRVLICGLLALFIAGLSPLGNWLMVPLEGRFTRTNIAGGAPVTGIIILGGAGDQMSDPPREIAPLNEAAERLTEAVALSRHLPQARIVFSGGSGPLFGTELPEAAIATQLLQAMGVAKERITLEERSRDTFENAVFTTQLLAPQPHQRWVLITSGWHMPRAIGCFRRAGFDVEPWPVDFRTSSHYDLELQRSISEGLRKVDFVIHEYVGLLMYFLAGRTNALWPAPAAVS